MAAQGDPSPTPEHRGIPLRQRVQLLTTAFLLLVAVVAITAGVTLRERDAAARELEQRIDPARAGLNDLINGMVDQETGLRGYLLTRDRALLEPYTAGQDQVEESLGELQQLIGADTELGPLLTRTDMAVRAWQHGSAQAELELADAGRFDDAIELVDQGSTRFDAFRAEVGALRQAMLEGQRAAGARAQDARTALTRLIMAMVLFACVLVSMTGVLLRRWVTTPLGQITAAADRVTGGDLHHPIPVTGPPDLAAHAANVEAMRARTVALFVEAVAAREALEQQAPAVVTLRAELQPRGGALPDSVQMVASLQAAKGVLAGDWYDCVDLGDGRVALILADVSGHGPAAGVFALRVKHLMHAALLETSEPGAALGWLAGHMEETDERFLTCLLVVLDTATGSLQWANAGHPAGVVLDGERLRRLDATGPLLGPLPGTWATGRTELPPGATMIAFTDGIVEARAGTEEFGDDRLLEILTREVTDPDRMIAALTNAVRTFTDGTFDDDVTIAVLHHRQPDDRRAVTEAEGLAVTVESV